MPTITVLGTIDADFSGVQIEDATAPSVAVFAKVGADQASGSFTSTHSGTAQYVIAGINAGTYDVVRDASVTVADDYAVGNDGTIAFTSTAGAFVIGDGTPAPPSITITTTSLPNGEDAVAYAQTLTYSGGTAPVTWSLAAGSLCSGLSLHTDTGVLDGTPDTEETCNFTIGIVDDQSQSDTQALSITIQAAASALDVTTTSLPNGTRGVAYAQVLQAIGGTSPYTWAITDGTLCTGLTLTAGTGGIAGTPTVTQTCNFTVEVTDDVAATDPQSLSITINEPASPVLQITTTTPLSACVQAQPCATQFAYQGGTPPVTWSKSAGTLCAGQSLNASTGLLDGAPTAVETCTFTITATDDAAATDSRQFQRSVVNPEPTLSVRAYPGSQGVVLRFGTRFLSRDQTCEVVVENPAIDDTTGLPFGPVSTATSTDGLATRVVAAGGLAEQTDYSASVTCGDAGSGTVAVGTVDFTTLPATGGSVSWRFDIKPVQKLLDQGVAKVSFYATSLDGGSDVASEHNSCASGCTVNLSLASGGAYSIIYVWEDSGNTEVTRLSANRAQYVSVP